MISKWHVSRIQRRICSSVFAIALSLADPIGVNRISTWHEACLEAIPVDCLTAAEHGSIVHDAATTLGGHRSGKL